LAIYVSESLPRSVREMAVFLNQRFGVVYESRSGLIALLHRLGFVYKRPRTIGRGIRVDDQQAFIGEYEKLLNSLASDKAVVFADVVHPIFAARAVGCWARPHDTPAIAQSAGRGRLNIHGALDLETGKTAMIEVETVDAASAIKLLQTIEARYPPRALVHVFVDNARYHHAVLVQQWLAQPGRRIRLHFIPNDCPHLNPIERLWGVMHKHLTHNRTRRNFREFSNAILSFVRLGNAKMCNSSAGFPLAHLTR
jgi:transposase